MTSLSHNASMILLLLFSSSATGFQSISYLSHLSTLRVGGGGFGISSSSLGLTKEQKEPIHEKAIIVGGGPIGLASALTLAKEGYQVSVFESTPTKELKTFNPFLAYLYNVNARGQIFTKSFPKVHEKLIERSVASSDTGIMIAPSDITKNITSPDVPAFGGDSVSYWIPRHEMNVLLWEAVDEHNANLQENDGTITFEQGMKCIQVSSNPFSTITPQKGDDMHSNTSSNDGTSVFVEDVVSGETKELIAKLVIGADGINSKVRQCLNKDSDKLNFEYNAKKFKIKKFISPASSLKLKALQIPTDQFAIIDADGKMKPVKGQDFAILRSTSNGPLDRLSFGCLPSKNEINIRPGNCIARPNHKLWSLKTGKEVKDWFHEIYPRIVWDELVDDKEWERFAKADGLAFPPCQYSPGLQVSNKDGDSGIVLLGDAAHSFSPDIGQGINAGLMDVVQFGELLRRSKEKKEKLSNVLRAYENIRAPETKSLIRIARFGSPYQYNQSLRKDRLGKKLWTLNVAFRLLMNKITFGLFPKPMIMMLSDNGLTYRQVARRADMGTLFVKSVGLFFILSKLSKRTFLSRFLMPI